MAKKFLDIMNIVGGLKVLVVGIVTGIVALPFYGLFMLFPKLSFLWLLLYAPFYFMVSGYAARILWGWR